MPSRFRLVPMLALGVASHAWCQVAQAPPDLAITRVTVVDVSTGELRPDQTVLVSAGRIIAMGPRAGIRIPPRARLIEGGGGYLIPGLHDMHVHLGSTGRSSLGVFVALGITAVREMGGEFAKVRFWRDSIAAGTLLGPRITMAGPIVENSRWLEAVNQLAADTHDTALIAGLHERIGISAPTQVPAAVDSIVRLGADFIKVRNDPPHAAFLALLSAARARGIGVAGHWPTRTLPGEASDSGMRSLEHGYLLSSRGVLYAGLDSLSPDDRQALFARFKKNGTAMVPTLIATRGFRLTPDSVLSRTIADSVGRVDPRRKYVAPGLIASWRSELELRKSETPFDWAPIYRSWAREVREMAATGGTVLAGTDVGSPLVFPGFGLQDELELLVTDGGLTPLQALQSATTSAAKFLAADSTAADLVLLDANPLVDIRAIRNIRAVILSGVLFDREALGRLLAAAAAHP